MKRVWKSRAAFTLLEVLVALAIMAVAFTALLGTQNGHLLMSERGEFMTTAVLLARSKMADLEMQFKNNPLPVNDLEEVKNASEKPFGDAYPEFGYRLSIRKVRLPLPQSLFEQPNLGTSAGGKSATTNNNNSQQLAGSASAIGDYLSQAIREVRLAVLWQSPSGADEIEIVTHFVDLNASIGIQ